MGYDDPNCTVFVKNVENRVTEEILWELFLQAGPLSSVKIPTNRETGERRGFAFVCYREEISVPYACELFNQIKLFKKPIYCNPSKRDRNGSAAQSPQSTPGTPNTPGSPQSPTAAKNLIQGILNRTNSGPQQTSTPYHGKRKLSVDGDSRVFIEDDNSDRGGRFDDRNGDRNMYRGRDSGGRDPGGRDSGGRDFGGRGGDGGRYNGGDGGRYSEHDDRGRGGFNDRSNDRFDNSSGGGGGDRSRGYDRSNSFNSSYGNSSPMHMQALNQSHRQYGRQASSPRGGNGGGNDFGRSPRGGGGQHGGDVMRGPDRNPRRQRSHQPY